MITFNSTDNNLDTKYRIDGYCLSSDTKPTDVANGSTLIEMDTQKVYMFDEANSQWHEFA